jgi:putative Holliday junction resolvase
LTRILGLDAGERRIGVAISDPDGSFALPLRSILVDGRELDAIDAYVRDEEIEAIVIGLPLSMSGESSAQTERARAFASRVESRTSLPVHLWDERLSTQEAMRHASVGDDRRTGRRSRGRATPQADTDAIAASIILQAYLDSLRLGPRIEP